MSGAPLVQPVAMPAANAPTWKYAHQAGAGTLLTKTGAGSMHSVNVNTLVGSGAVTIYDGVDATGTIIARIVFPAVLLSNGPATGMYDIAFTTGLYVVVAGAMDLTISYL